MIVLNTGVYFLNYRKNNSVIGFSVKLFFQVALDYCYKCNRSAATEAADTQLKIQLSHHDQCYL